MISDAVWLALIGGVPATLAATGALLQSMSNSKKHDIGLKKQDELEGKADVIKAHTDGTISDLRAEIRANLTEINNLREIIRILTEGKSEEARIQMLLERETLNRQREVLETKVMEEMQSHADTKVELIKARVSKPVDPENL